MPTNGNGWVEISRLALLHNLRQLQYWVAPASLWPVVKANAYGLGATEVSGVLEPFVPGVWVEDANEAARLRSGGFAKPIRVLGYVEPEVLSRLLPGEIEPALYHEGQLEALGPGWTVHLMLDVELGRDGLMMDQAAALAQACVNNGVIIGSVYGHFANVEDTVDSTHALRQIDLFNEQYASLQNMLPYHVPGHVSATAAAMRYEKGGVRQEVRSGIGLWGLWPSEDMRQFFAPGELRPVLSWKSRIAQLKRVPAGYPVGYGLTFVTDRPTTIAVLPQGYSDGLDRGLSNEGEVLVAGRRCRIRGRVAMNMCVIEIPDDLNVSVDDEIVIIGRQGQENITAEEVATRIGTINYEIIARISPLLPRVIVD